VLSHRALCLYLSLSVTYSLAHSFLSFSLLLLLLLSSLFHDLFSHTPSPGGRPSEPPHASMALAARLLSRHWQRGAAARTAEANSAAGRSLRQHGPTDPSAFGVYCRGAPFFIPSCLSRFPKLPSPPPLLLLLLEYQPCQRRPLLACAECMYSIILCCVIGAGELGRSDRSRASVLVGRTAPSRGGSSGTAANGHGRAAIRAPNHY